MQVGEWIAAMQIRCLSDRVGCLPGTSVSGGKRGERVRAWSIAAILMAIALSMSGCSQESPDALIESAKEYLAKNDVKAAIIQLKNVLQLDPDSAEGRFLLGKALLEEGNSAGAVVELRRARSLRYPDDLVIPPLAKALVAQGQLKTVAEEFADIRLGDRSAEADLQVALAKAYVGLRLHELAEGAVRAALNAKPDHLPSQIMQARLLWQRGDLQGAMKEAESILAASADADEAWTLKGSLILASNGNRDAALEAFRQGIALNPRNLEAHSGALLIVGARNDAAQLQAQLDLLTAEFPKHPQAQLFQAQLAYMRGDLKAARELIDPIVAASPDNVPVLVLAGAVELHSGLLLEAEAHLARAVQLSPNLLLARRLLIRTLLRSGQTTKALSASQPALAVAQPDPQIVAMAAEAHLLDGDLDRATEMFARAAKLNPKDMRSRAALALNEVARGNPEVGFQQLERIAEEDRGSTAELALISAHLQRKEYDAALKTIDALERKEPGKPRAPYLRGRVQLALKNPEQARKGFEQALAVDASYLPAIATLAGLDVLGGKPEAARKRFQAVLEKDPNNVSSMLGLAEVTAATGGNKDEVARLLNDAIKAAPQQPRQRLLLVDYLIRQRDLRGAMVAAQDGVSALPTSAQMIDALGRAQLASGDGNQAIANFSKVAVMQPQSPEAQLRLAGAFLATGDQRAARSTLQRALSLKADFLDAQRLLILLEIVSQRPQEALAVARTVQKQRPTQAVGFVLEGDIASRQKDFNAAERAFRTALSRAPDSSEVAAKLHVALVDAGKTSEAEAFASSWTKGHPGDAQFPALLGDHAVSREEFGRAEGLYRKSLELKPESPLVINNLAMVIARQGKPGALQLAERANGMAPDQPAIMDTLAFVLATSGQLEQAVDLQQKIVALEPGVALYRLNLAKIYLKAGRKADAEGELTILSKLGDKFAGQAEVAQLLKSLKPG